jgi:hypothetical protein
VVAEIRRQQLQVDASRSTLDHPLDMPLPPAADNAERHRRPALVVPVGYQVHAGVSTANPSLDSIANKRNIFLWQVQVPQ